MKAPLVFLLLATVQICLSAPTLDFDGLKSGIAHAGHGAGHGGHGGGVGNGEGSDDDGSSGHGHGHGGNGDNSDDDASGHGGHGDGGNGDNGDDDDSSGDGGHGDGGNGDNGDDDGSSGHGGHGDGGNGHNGDVDDSSGHGAGHGIPKLPGAPCDDEYRSPVPGVNYLNPPAKVAPGGVGIIGHSNPTLYHINKAKSDAVHGVTKTAESASHLDLKRTSQLGLNTVDKVVNDARGTLDTVGLGPAADAVYGAYIGVSQTAHHTAAGVADTANVADGGLTKGDLL